MLKNRYILVFLLCVLMPVTALHAETVTSIVDGKALKNALNESTHRTSWTHGEGRQKVTFVLSGTSTSVYTVLGNFYLSCGPTAKVLGAIVPLGNETTSYSISWQVDDYYDIAVSKVTLNVDRASYSGSYITVGDGERIGDLFNKLFSNWNISSGSKVYTTFEILPIVFEKADLWSTVSVNSITITYELVPKFIFLGNGGGGESEELKWEKKENWFPKDKLPTINDSVFIRHDVIISESATAKSVIIEKKTMTDELSKVTVEPTGVLKVGAGGVKNATTTNFMLQAGTSGEEIGQTGVLLIDPSSTEPMPNATAEMFSVAYFDMNEGKPDNNAGAYQYVGSPMKEDNVKARDIFTNSWIYNWDEASGEWKNNRRNLILKPFEGYCTSQYSNELGLKIEHKGQLASNANVDLQLSCNGSSAELRGINVFANSYAAPIDITKFELTDFSDGVEATIYLFNTGSKNDIEAREGQAVNVKARGQFLSIPVKAIPSGYPTVIPAMQGFYVKTTKDHSTVTLNYEHLVWNAVSKNTPLHAKRVWEEKNGALCIVVEADGWKDQVFLLESEEYDAAFENGYDAHKLMSGNLNIFALEGEDALAVDATNSIAGTKIAVRTGAETAYTLTFGALSGEAEWSLYDAETKETVDIEEGSQYTFFAEPNTVLADRFQIQERNDMPAITTDLESVGNDAKAHKFIKDGRLFIIKNGLMYNAMGIAVGR